MCQLVETIKCKNGKICNIAYHNTRFNNSRRELFGIHEIIDLSDFIFIPEHANSGTFKCRVLYKKEIGSIEFTAYQPRNISSLKIVFDPEIHYPFKYTDRNQLELLYEKRGECDDIVIVKNGFITDSYMANLIFWDGKKWYTPATPLLQGIQRAKLLKEGKIFQCPVKLEDLSAFKKVGLINAFQDLEEMPEIPTSQIRT
ncbi:MAG TPA: aminotransferase class IV family protein [Prolixibacteraceae bacterium]|nr:aminotransferase class IV family protein [Prolixibacteraceae bacterium]